MLVDKSWLYGMKERDFIYYEQLLPNEDPLLDALELIDWDSMTSVLNEYYCADQGQPAISPLLMLKLEFIRYYRRLSDREVIARSRTDIVYRYFLQIPVKFRLPAPTSLVNFRSRLGVEGFQAVFDKLIALARQAGVVRDRLRLKDASHVFANISVPSTMQLLAQLRQRMLVQINSFDPNVGTAFEVELYQIRKDTAEASQEIRLQQRVELIKSMQSWLKELLDKRKSMQLPVTPKAESVCELASKILDDVTHPGQGDRTLSVVDPEARRGRHGQWYDGYCMDLMMDADSQLITSIDVIAAGGDEAQSAINLVKMEQQAHGNKIEALSIDGVGFNGPMLHELENPEGLAVTVYTPTRESSNEEAIGVEEFELSEDGRQVTCPAGNKSSTRQRDESRHRSYFQFSRTACEGCPLQAQCKPKLGEGRYGGRGVTKNDYEADHQRARARTKTPEYAEVRREHPAIERKINEVMNHQDGRFAKYWGRSKIRIQALMTGFTVNIKRMIKLNAKSGPAPMMS